MQRKLPEQDIAQGSYIALPLTLLVLLAGYNHDKVGSLEASWEADVLGRGAAAEECPVFTEVRALLGQVQSWRPPSKAINHSSQLS